MTATDGMMNGAPYIMFEDTYYAELYPDADFFKTDKDAISLLIRYLDDRTYRNTRARDALRYTKKHLVYADAIVERSSYIDRLVLKLPKTISSYLNEDDEYEIWLELLKRQDKKDKRIMSKLMSRRIGKKTSRE